ncbi:MAG: hypothetical protein ACR2J9_10925, partial [Gaiellales bacterium]
MSQTTATSTSTRHPRARLLKALRSACLIAASSLTLALAITAAPAAAAGPEPPMPLNGIAASMPTIADVAGAGLLPSTSHLSGTARLRSPYPCADYAARGVAGTSHWGEWEAKSSEGNRVRVITFSYGDARIDTAWSKLKAAIAACPTVLARTDTGGPGITTQQIISTTADAVRFELTVRGPDGDRNVGEDRAIVYQRVDDAIQKVQVARRTVTDGDRSLLTRLTATTRARYVAARAGTGTGGDFEAALVAAAPPIGPLIGNAAYPGVEAVG